MKKRWRKIGFVLIAMLVLLSGCSKKGAETTEEQDEKTVKEETKTETKTEAENKDKQGEGIKSESGSATAPEVEQKGPVTFHVYYSNEDADELVKESVEVDEISPEYALSVLIEKGALPENVKLNSLNESEKDGERVLDVDFSQEFADYMNNVGAAGEYMSLGGVCNTFLDAYGCKKIRITVEGGVFTTGHNEYPGYLGFHES